MEPVLLAIDQGTTSTRAIAFDLQLRPLVSASRSLTTSHPRPGWVEQDPEEIQESVVATVTEVLEGVGGPRAVVATGLANQGETVVAWDASSGLALAPAVVWQCRRSAQIDLREPLRQEILVALPMRPDCGPECPGPDVLEVGAEDDGVVDARLAALASLLGDDQTQD